MQSFKCGCGAFGNIDISTINFCPYCGKSLTASPQAGTEAVSAEFALLTDIADFKPGTIIRGKSTGNVFVVTANYGTRATAVMTQDICNPNEWEAIGS